MKDDGYGRMRHYSRAGAGFVTYFVPNEGYYWQHVSADGSHLGKRGGPYPTRRAAEKAA